MRRLRKHPRLSDANAALIARMIDDLPQKAVITWSDVVALASKQLRVKWSRQTLEKRKQIKDAYLRRFAQRRGIDEKGPRRSGRAGEEAERRILNLKDENEKLRRRLEEYDRRLMRYVLNAIAHGVTEKELDAPILPLGSESKSTGENDKKARR
ncbi:hypothetical protein B0G76_7431 [Paraburkholderia sp. BL23I1N1]|nr:hypothetical protein B0G76_7431 [Paraburkholderia sp. BL23I1N1]